MNIFVPKENPYDVDPHMHAPHFDEPKRPPGILKRTSTSLPSFKRSLPNSSSHDVYSNSVPNIEDQKKSQ